MTTARKAPTSGPTQKIQYWWNVRLTMAGPNPLAGFTLQTSMPHHQSSVILDKIVLAVIGVTEPQQQVFAALTDDVFAAVAASTARLR